MHPYDMEKFKNTGIVGPPDRKHVSGGGVVVNTTGGLFRRDIKRKVRELRKQRVKQLKGTQPRGSRHA